MIVQVEKPASLSIDGDNGWSLKSQWLLQPESIPATADALNRWQEEIKTWLPKPGDPWRIPADDRPYTTDDGWTVASVRSEELPDSPLHVCKVTVSGVPGGSAAVEKMKSTETYSPAGEHFRTSSWLVPAEALGEWLPEVGENLDWDGGRFCCSMINMRESDGGRWLVEIRAVDLEVEPPPEIAYRRNHDFETEKYGTWRVAANALETFRAANDVNSVAEWAGNSYRITECKITPDSANIFKVSLTARDINVRLIGVTRSERFIGFTARKKVRRRVEWESRWRVHKNSLRRFENITGASARSWTGCNSVVVTSKSSRLSDYEFEYILTAVPRRNSMYEVSSDDRSDLSGRIDISGELAEMILSPEQCGWRRGASGELTEIPSWNPLRECPLATQGPLPVNLVEAPLKTLLASETRYFRFKTFTLLSHIDNWMISGRVWFGTVGGVSAWWLKEDIVNEIITDDSGETWRKVTCIYRQPPAGYSWNGTYWNTRSN